MAQKHYVMTVMATNRVGILAALATALDELGGSFIDVSLAIMRQYFTLIAAVEFPESREPKVIVDHIRAVCRPFGGDVMIRDPAESESPASDAFDDELSRELGFESERPAVEAPEVAPSTVRYFLQMQGQDRPGVLRKVSMRMAQEGIDITDLYGERDDEAQRFASCLELAVPTGADVSRVFRELQQAYYGQGVTFELYRDDLLQAISHPEPLRVRLPPKVRRVG